MRVGIATDHGGFGLKEELLNTLNIRGGGAGAPVRANKLKGIRAALIHDHLSAKQGVQDDHLNILCMDARAVGPLVAWDLVDGFLNARFSQELRQLRRLGKVANAEAGTCC